MKTCTKCNKDKPLESFSKNKGTPDGLRYICKQCASAVYKDWHSKNKDRKAKSRRDFYLNNKEREAATHKAWVDQNRGRKNALNVKRIAAKLQRTPAWNDDLVMQMIYEDCPEGHHVDHIVPLQGKNVSGLHVHYNLQWLPAEENIRKSNQWH